MKIVHSTPAAGDGRERFDFDIATIRVYGTITNLGDNTCRLSAWFDNATVPCVAELDIRDVSRQNLADALRTLADQMAPQEGGSYAFRCELHVDDLEGEPQWAYDPHVCGWELTMDSMECRHADNGQSCRPAWRMAALGVARKEVA
jgi:hypothetical protein